MEKLADADEVLFGYIQDRIKVLHGNKTEYEKSLMLMERKIIKVNTKPLIDPLNKWGELTVQEKNQLAMLMIDKIFCLMIMVLILGSAFDNEKSGVRNT